MGESRIFSTTLRHFFFRLLLLLTFFLRLSSLIFTYRHLYFLFMLQTGAQAPTNQAVIDAITLLAGFYSGILEQLQPYSHWIVWQRAGQQKVPYNPTEHYQASSSKPQTWGTLAQALKALTTGRYRGIGFMLDPQSVPLTFIDLDHCFNQATETITNPKAAKIVAQMESYTEISPSGEGLHILVIGRLPGSGMHTDVEMYDRGRYFTVTAHHLSGTPRTIAHCQEKIGALYHEYKPKVAMQIQNTVGVRESWGASLTGLPPEADRDTLLQALLHGDTTAYNGDESRADFVLLMKLLYWTGDNVALSKQLFLASPLGQRKKVLEKRGQSTYLDMTIRNVLWKRRNLPLQR